MRVAEKGGGKPAQPGEEGERLGDAKRVLKFRRLHLVHSLAVTARQTVAVTALVLEFSLSLSLVLPRLLFFSF